MREQQPAPGDVLAVYTDGVTEAKKARRLAKPACLPSRLLDQFIAAGAFPTSCCERS